MCVLRGGEEEQTPGASVSGLRPWRQGLAALTEVATNADVQTLTLRAPLLETHARPHAHRHTPGEKVEKEAVKRRRGTKRNKKTEGS